MKQEWEQYACHLGKRCAGLICPEEFWGNSLSSRLQRITNPDKAAASSADKTDKHKQTVGKSPKEDRPYTSNHTAKDIKHEGNCETSLGGRSANPLKNFEENRSGSRPTCATSSGRKGSGSVSKQDTLFRAKRLLNIAHAQKKQAKDEVVQDEEEGDADQKQTTLSQTRPVTIKENELDLGVTALQTETCQNADGAKSGSVGIATYIIPIVPKSPTIKIEDKPKSGESPPPKPFRLCYSQSHITLGKQGNNRLKMPSMENINDPSLSNLDMENSHKVDLGDSPVFPLEDLVSNPDSWPETSESLNQMGPTNTNHFVSLVLKTVVFEDQPQIESTSAPCLGSRRPFSTKSRSKSAKPLRGSSASRKNGAVALSTDSPFVNKTTKETFSISGGLDAYANHYKDSLSSRVMPIGDLLPAVDRNLKGVMTAQRQRHSGYNGDYTSWPVRGTTGSGRNKLPHEDSLVLIRDGIQLLKLKENTNAVSSVVIFLLSNSVSPISFHPLPLHLQ